MRSLINSISIIPVEIQTTAWIILLTVNAAMATWLISALQTETKQHQEEVVWVLLVS